MKKLIKNNLKVIITFIVTSIICISGTLFAAVKYQASQIGYKDDKNVEEALNELYQRGNGYTLLGSQKISTTNKTIINTNNMNNYKWIYIVLVQESCSTFNSSSTLNATSALSPIGGVINVQKEYFKINEQTTYYAYGNNGSGKYTSVTFSYESDTSIGVKTGVANERTVFIYGM